MKIVLTVALVALATSLSAQPFAQLDGAVTKEVRRQAAAQQVKRLTFEEAGIVKQIFNNSQLVTHIGEYMQTCDFTFQPERLPVEKAIINHILTHTGDTFSASDECTTKRVAVQNELASHYYSSRLRYTPATPVDNSKEAAFLQRVYAKVRGYFKISPQSVENARKSILGKRAGLYQEPSRFAVPDSIKNKK